MRNSLLALVLMALAALGCGGTGFSGRPTSAASLTANGSAKLVIDDMAFGEDELPRLGGSLAPANGKFRAASGFGVYRSIPWPGGVIPVHFDSSVNAERRAQFFDACQAWSASGISCVQRSDQPGYLFVTGTPQGKCTTEVGAGPSPRERVFTFGIDWCWYKAGLIHEIGHVIGLMHEHQRPDRDTYLIIHRENLIAELAYAYDKLALEGHDSSSPYDFYSVMHYWDSSYAMTGLKAMTMRPGYEQYQAVIGKQTYPSNSDLDVVRKIYGYTSASGATTGSSAPGGTSSSAPGGTTSDTTSGGSTSGDSTPSASGPSRSGAKTLINAFHRYLLGRAPTSGEATKWIEKAMSSGCNKAAAEFMKRSDYRDKAVKRTDSEFVTSLYKGLLAIVPTNRQVSNGLTELNQGFTRRNMETFLREDNKFIARCKKLGLNY